MEYLFQSKRLGFRSWTPSDLKPMSAINADPDVMEYFPNTQTKNDTLAFITRMQTQFDEKGYCYFAVDQLDTKEFIGFIGLSYQTYESEFTPCVDIGWRLAKDHWGNGYATEGAQRCLQFAFETLGLKEVLSIASLINQPSIRVMEKIGMSKVMNFELGLLKDDYRLKKCVLYRIGKTIKSHHLPPLHLR